MEINKSASANKEIPKTPIICETPGLQLPCTPCTSLPATVLIKREPIDRCYGSSSNEDFWTPQGVLVSRYSGHPGGLPSGVSHIKCHAIITKLRQRVIQLNQKLDRKNYRFAEVLRSGDNEVSKGIIRITEKLQEEKEKLLEELQVKSSELTDCVAYGEELQKKLKKVTKELDDEKSKKAKEAQEIAASTDIEDRLDKRIHDLEMLYKLELNDSQQLVVTLELENKKLKLENQLLMFSKENQYKTGATNAGTSPEKSIQTGNALQTAHIKENMNPKHLRMANGGTNPGKNSQIGINSNSNQQNLMNKNNNGQNNNNKKPEGMNGTKSGGNNQSAFKPLISIDFSPKGKNRKFLPAWRKRPYSNPNNGRFNNRNEQPAKVGRFDNPFYNHRK